MQSFLLRSPLKTVTTAAVAAASFGALSLATVAPAQAYRGGGAVFHHFGGFGHGGFRGGYGRFGYRGGWGARRFGYGGWGARRFGWGGYGYRRFGWGYPALGFGVGYGLAAATYGYGTPYGGYGYGYDAAPAADAGYDEGGYPAPRGQCNSYSTGTHLDKRYC